MRSWSTIRMDATCGAVYNDQSVTTKSQRRDEAVQALGGRRNRVGRGRRESTDCRSVELFEGVAFVISTRVGSTIGSVALDETMNGTELLCNRFLLR